MKFKIWNIISKKPKNIAKKLRMPLKPLFYNGLFNYFGGDSYSTKQDKRA